MTEQGANSNGSAKERAILVGVYGEETLRPQAEEYIDELELLADTAGAVTVEKILQNRMHPDPGSYVGKGKVRELKFLVESHNIDTIIFDDDLTATQIRNVERETKTKVVDRSGLILDIFASRAKTSASRSQVELAQLQYLLPRLTRFWTHLSRQKGGIGTKGPGEAQIETDRRLIGKRISVLKEKLQKLDRQRTVQRQGREGSVRVALVGYTNAGKSTLMNTLTESAVLAEDRLFATLDSTVRRLELANHTVLLSDTVGFIRKLPHNLIESFKSTLDEVREADVIMHVVDISSVSVDEQIEVVNKTLEELGVKDVRKIEVFNKVDLLDPEKLPALKNRYPDGLFVSAERGMGIGRVKERLEKLIEENYVDFNYKIPLTHYRAVAFLHDTGVIEKEHYEESSVIIEGRVSKRDQRRFEALLSEIDPVKDSKTL